MLTTDPGTLKIRIIAFNALLRHTVRKRKKTARFLLPPGFGRLPFRETERLALFVPVFRNVFPRLHRRPDRNLVVSRIISPQLCLTLLIKSAFLFKVHLVIWNLSCILHFEQFCV